MKNLKESIFSFKERLVNIGKEEPLSKLSLVVIIALDLFILGVVFEGLHDHTQQITSPNEYVPNQCKEIFISKNWSETNFLSKLQDLVLSEYNNYSYRDDSILKSADTKVMHKSCQEFYTKVKLLADDKAIINLFASRQELVKQQDLLTRELKKSKDVYDTSLLEDIAEKKKKDDKLLAIKSTISSEKKELERITQKLIHNEGKINSDPKVSELNSMLNPDNRYRKEIIDDFKRFQVFYPLKELGWQLIFMLPLFFIFYIWSSLSVKKHNKVQTLISTHLLVVASIPIIFKIVEVVLDLIPHHFFKNLFNFLKSLHIIAIWHYLVIFFSVFIALFVVYIIQKKIFNKQRIQQKRVMRGACYSCGNKMPDEIQPYCPFCGARQFNTCKNCQEKTYVCGNFCKNCGEKVQEE